MVSSVESVGLVGKAPAQADFVRLEAGDAAAQALLKWMEESDDVFRRTGTAPPSTPTSFFFCGPSLRNALIGVLVPSRDQVGRAFPLALFASLPLGSVATFFPLVPTAFGEFLSSAATVLEEASRLSLGQLTERLRNLPRPTTLDWERARARQQALLEGAGSGWMNELTQSGGPLSAHYALRTLVAACRERAKEPPRSPVVLKCPLGSAGASPWLALAARILRWPPPFLWTEVSGALLLGLGTLPAASLSYLTRPDSTVPSLWSLQTSQMAARESAREALSVEQRKAIEAGDASVGQLIAALAS